MMSRQRLAGFTSATYASRSWQRNMSGSRASTICTTTSDRSMTRHSCFHTSTFFSNGVTPAWFRPGAANCCSTLQSANSKAVCGAGRHAAETTRTRTWQSEPST